AICEQNRNETSAAAESGLQQRDLVGNGIALAARLDRGTGIGAVDFLVDAAHARLQAERAVDEIAEVGRQIAPAGGLVAGRRGIEPYLRFLRRDLVARHLSGI